MEIIQFVAEALGDSSYLVISNGEAAVIDPQRDVRPYLSAAARRGARISRVFETHVHNDYVSGGAELAARGAEIVAPAGAGLEFPHRAVADGDEVRVGGAVIRAVHAPGHTPHHTAYLAIDEAGETAAAFTGGSIIIGGAGRSDLLGPEHREELTRLQWESAHRLAALLPDEAEILPTHGGGSFCAAPHVGTERRARLADERLRNLVLVSPDFESFRAAHLANPAPIPGYYAHMASINRRGPQVYGEPPRPPLLTVADLAQPGDAYVMDVRSRFRFAEGHVPGSLSLEEGSGMLAYVGWLIPFNHELALVSENREQAERVAVDLLRIGYEQVRGYLPFADWAADRPVATLEVVDIEEAARLRSEGRLPLYDVRFNSDLQEAPLPGASHLPIDRLPDWIERETEQEMLVVCGAGSRAATAASMLQTRGRRPHVLIRGGASDLARAAAVNASAAGEAARRLAG